MKAFRFTIMGMLAILTLVSCGGQENASSMANVPESISSQTSSTSVSASSTTSIIEAPSTSIISAPEGDASESMNSLMDYDMYFSQERVFEIDPALDVPRATRNAECLDGSTYFINEEGDSLYRREMNTGEIDLIISNKSSIETLYTDGNILFFLTTDTGTIYRLHYGSGTIDTMATLKNDHYYIPYSNFIVLWTEVIPGYENFKGTTPTTLHAWDSRVGGEVEPPMGAFFPLYGTYDGPRDAVEWYGEPTNP